MKTCTGHCPARFNPARKPAPGLLLVVWTILSCPLVHHTWGQAAPSPLRMEVEFPANRQVPDRGEMVDARTLSLGGAARIDQVAVQLRISPREDGGFNGDLYAFISHADAISVLLNRTGRRTGNPFGYGDEGFDVLLRDDGAAGDIHTYRLELTGSHTIPLGGPVTGEWSPDGRAVNPAQVEIASPRTAMLDGLAGADASGSWQLFLADLSSGGVSRLDSWGLRLDISPGAGARLDLVHPASLQSDLPETDFSVSSGGIIRGTGAVRGLSVGQGGSIAPGANVGRIEAQTLELGAGGEFMCELNAADGVAGGREGWDLIECAALVVTATSEEPFRIRLRSIREDGTAGPSARWDPGQMRRWTVIRSGSGVSAPAPGQLVLDASEFDHDLAGGRLSLQWSADELQIVFSPGGAPETVRLGGSVRYQLDGQPLAGVLVRIEGTIEAEQVTDAQGQYEFEVSPLGSYRISAVGPADRPAAGVSTLDISLIRRHILLFNLLPSPFQLIAADANGSGSISTVDIVQFRRVILGFSVSVTGGNWQMIQWDHVFSNPAQPWAFPSDWELTNPMTDRMDLHFGGIKRGDVNGSWAPEPAGLLAAKATRPYRLLAGEPPLVLAIGTVTIGEDLAVDVPVVAERVADVSGMQFTIEWDPERLRFVSVGEFGWPALGAGNLAQHQADAGRLMLSWDDPTGGGISREPGETAFVLRFAPVGDWTGSSSVRFVDSPTPREASSGIDVVEFVTRDGAVVRADSETPLTLRAELVRQDDGPPRVRLVVSGARDGHQYTLEESDDFASGWRPLLDWEAQAGTDAVELEVQGSARFFRIGPGEASVEPGL